MKWRVNSHIECMKYMILDIYIYLNFPSVVKPISEQYINIYVYYYTKVIYITNFNFAM